MVLADQAIGCACDHTTRRVYLKQHGRRTMQKSVDRILVTHVGSLPRGEELSELLIEQEAGRPVDNRKLAEEVNRRVAHVLKKQREAGIDIANDGEQGRVGFQTYVPQRVSGFGGTSKRPLAQEF